MYYSVCLSALYSKLPLHEALVQTADTGVKACEFWGWWGQDIDALEKAQKEHGMAIAALCTRMIPLTDPAQRDAYLDGLRETLPVAARLGCRTIISQVGAELVHLTRDEQHQSIVEGLRACVPLLEEAGVTLVIEPLNTLVNHPGYFLTRSDEAFAIVKAVGSPHVKVLFDIYHQQITEGNLIPNLTANTAWIGHIHIAGHPGRHEVLENSEIHYPAVLGALQKAGYTGAVGLEYIPLGDPSQSVRDLLKAIPLE